MKILHYCDNCIGSAVCTKCATNICTSSEDYNNIIFRIDCDEYRGRPGYAYGTSLTYSEFRSEFTHCDDCVMSECCKFHNCQEMHDEVNLIRTRLLERGFTKVVVTCISHSVREDDTSHKTGYTSRIVPMDDGTMTIKIESKTTMPKSKSQELWNNFINKIKGWIK